MDVDNETKLEIFIKEEKITIEQENSEELTDDKADIVKDIKIEGKSSDADYILSDSRSSSEDEESSESIHFCQYCEFKTKYRGNLKQHQNSIHLGKVELCQICGRKYKDPSNLNRHIRIRHNDKTHKKFKISLQTVQIHNCIYCDFTTTRKENLQTHMNSLHLLENIYTCEICNYLGTRIDSYRRHMQAIHGPKKKHYECRRCSFKTLRKDFFDSHFKENHIEFKNFPCDFCEYRATYACNRRRHIIRKHSR